jgi:hypothetical protein
MPSRQLQLCNLHKKATSPQRCLRGNPEAKNDGSGTRKGNDSNSESQRENPPQTWGKGNLLAVFHTTHQRNIQRTAEGSFEDFLSHPSFVICEKGCAKELKTTYCRCYGGKT